ncbi:hypothetical protein BH09BAC4_BH09BAC4_44600 [soil metagenome]
MDNQSRDLLNADELLAEPLVPASRTKRFLNLLIDTTFFYILIFSLVMVIGIGVELISPGTSSSFVETDRSANLLINMLFFALFLTYYIAFETWLGRTPGKMITKTKVVDRAGRKPVLVSIFWRNLARFMPFEAFSFLREKPIGIHDRISKTMVVNDLPEPSLDLLLRQLPE